jgi:non-ribosomal peptide synthetase component F
MVAANLQLGRNPSSRRSLFPVVLALHNMPQAALELPALQVQSQQQQSGAPIRFDVLVNLFDNGRALSGWITYATELFDASTIETLSRQFRSLLEQAVIRPEARLSEYASFAATCPARAQVAATTT